MNWRHTEPVQQPGQKGQAPGEVGTMDHYYDHPNERLFPGDGPYGSGFSEWFSWLESHKLRTYFNDREHQQRPSPSVRARRKPMNLRKPFPSDAHG